MMQQLQDGGVFMPESDLFKTHCALNDLDRESALRVGRKCKQEF